MSQKTPTASEAQQEQDPRFFHFSATLRIFGDGVDIDEVSRTLCLAPTRAYRKGQKRRPSGSDWWSMDMWSYKAPVDKDRPLHDHIMAIWDAVRPHIPYLRRLKERFHVDIFCGYRTNDCTAGFVVDHRCLGLFMELEVPFGVSVVVS
jgi:hypothetical protein